MAAVIDPTVDEVAQFATLSDIYAWAKIAGDVNDPATHRGALHAALGCDESTTPRDLAFVDYAELATTFASLRVGTGDAAVPLSPVLASKSRLFLHACGIAAGSVNRKIDTTGGMPAGGVPVPLPFVPPPNGARALTLNSIVDQSAEDECPPLDAERIDAMFAHYRQLFGANPMEDMEPTADQLSAIQHMVVERKLPPYVDFAVFGPHALRTARKFRLQGLLLGAQGQLFQSEVYGPRCFAQWLSCFQVFKVAAVMMDLISCSALDRYCELIRSYNALYGDACWPLLYQADTRARRELVERIRRRLAGDYEDLHRIAMATTGTMPVTDFDPKAPWKTVWAAIPLEYSFWKREVEDPSVMIITKVRAGSFVSGEAPVDQAARGSGQPHGETGTPAPKPPGKKRKRLSQDDRQRNKGSDGFWSTNRRGLKLCAEFQNNACTHPCPHQHAHQCKKCLFPSHGFVDHKDSPGGNGKGGGGKGRRQ